jgi:ferredoxin
MAYVIAEPCIDVLDLSCVAVCPVDCIHYDEGVDRKLFIDPNECIDCGACEPECPVNAIFPEESLPPEWATYTQIDATWFTDTDAARRAVDEAKPACSRRRLGGIGRGPIRGTRTGPGGEIAGHGADAHRLPSPVGHGDRLRARPR